MSPRIPHCFRRFLFILPIFWAGLAWSASAPDWLIATTDETAKANAPLSIEIVKPAATADWPSHVDLRLTGDGVARTISLTPVTVAANGAMRRAYVGTLPGDLSGLVRAELASPASNRLMLMIEESAPTAIATATAAAYPPERPPSAQANVPVTIPVAELTTTDNFVFSPHEPMYFVVGSRNGTNARFQLSFKYQLFDPKSHVAQWLPPLAGLYLGYTQTSRWDLAGDSKPFRDTSYRPSFFWQMQPSGSGWWPLQVRMGYEHESNGQDGAASRSIDMLFVRPAWRWEFADGEALSFIPKIYGYLDKSDNRDIQRYRGYVDWTLCYGDENGWLTTAQLRRGTMGKGSTQIDLSVPFRTPVFMRIGGFLNFQLFSGYGEDLLGYNVKSAPQFRIGISLVR